MRIGIDARIVHYAGGGIGNYVRRLLLSLAALDSGNDYRVLYARRGRPPVPPRANFHPVACLTPPHNRRERWALGAEVSRLGLDLLHSPDFIPPAYGYRRSVITVHDLTFIYYPQFLTAEGRRYYSRQIQWAVRRADHILADSYSTRADLVGLLDVPEEKVTVVHLAAAPAFRPLPADEISAVLERYRLSPGYLLCVGTLEPRKNIPGLLRAYRALLDDRTTDVPLVLVGRKGWLYDEIFAEVEVLHLMKDVRFLHDVSDADLPAIYNGAAVLVLPSFYEGFGLPVLEAMACGTPVVVAERASLPEVAGEAGLLVNPNEPWDIAQGIARVLGDCSLQAQMRALGLAQAARFSWERTARETLAVYERVLAV